MTKPLTPEELENLAQSAKDTQAAAEKVESTLKASAAMLVQAKESMIIAMLQENLDAETISIATKTPVDTIEKIRLNMQ